MTRPVAALVFAVVALALEGATPVAQAPGGPRFVGQASPPATPLSLWYRQPAADRPPTPRPANAIATAEWVRALPVGNGRLGAMIFVGRARKTGPSAYCSTDGR